VGVAVEAECRDKYARFAGRLHHHQSGPRANTAAPLEPFECTPHAANVQAATVAVMVSEAGGGPPPEAGQRRQPPSWLLAQDCKLLALYGATKISPVQVLLPQVLSLLGCMQWTTAAAWSLRCCGCSPMQQAARGRKTAAKPWRQQSRERSQQRQRMRWAHAEAQIISKQYTLRMR
jgi:hypothetical protein